MVWLTAQFDGHWCETWTSFLSPPCYTNLSIEIVSQIVTQRAPAFPNTGALARVNDDGTFTILVDHLNQPTSLEFIGNTAYVTLLSGSILKIENLPK